MAYDWLRDVVHRSPRGVSRAFELGMAEDYRSHVVAGVPDPPSADEVVRTIDEILAGLYTGDMDIAMGTLRRVCARGGVGYPHRLCALCRAGWCGSGQPRG